MLEKIGRVTPPPPESKKEVPLEQFENAIRSFFKEQWPKDSGTERIKYGDDFDISNPERDDIKSAQSGNFEITNFRTSPRSDSEKLNFHVHIGSTEFHISGKAADRVYELAKK